MATHFVMFYTATAGANGPSLGSDEEDIVLMQYLVWDSQATKVGICLPYYLPLKVVGNHAAVSRSP